MSTALEILTPRDVPLGGLRAMTVRRTLPQRRRSFIGAWCFADHYGPDDVAVTGGMRVPPHPHTGLQTVSWLFSGEIEHRDSLGTRSTVRPGELNLMTAGRGISHSEDSTPGTTLLHGVQLWVALPDAERETAPAFEHVIPPVLEVDGGELRVFVGGLPGRSAPSPARTFSRLLGAEVTLQPGARLELALDPSFEHGYLLDAGDLEVDGTVVQPGELGYAPPGPDRVLLTAGERGVRLVLLGGEPLDEPVVMWWNFVGRDHDAVAAARRDWQAQIGADEAAIAAAGDPTAGDVPDADLTAPDGVPDGVLPAGATDRPGRFGTVEGYPAPPLPAPVLPPLRLLPRH